MAEQPKAPTGQAVYTVTGEAVIDGKVMISAPAPVTPAGFTLIAETVAAGGSRLFRVVAGPARIAGHAMLQKTCIEPVTFYIHRDGEPYHQAIVTSPFEGLDIDLAPLFR